MAAVWRTDIRVRVEAGEPGRRPQQDWVSDGGGGSGGREERSGTEYISNMEPKEFADGLQRVSKWEV